MTTKQKSQFLLDLQNRLKELYPLTFVTEISKLSEIISDYKREEEIRDGIIESLSECV